MKLMKALLKLKKASGEDPLTYTGSICEFWID